MSIEQIGYLKSEMGAESRAWERPDQLASSFIREGLSQYFADKGFSESGLERLAGSNQLGPLIDSYFLGNYTVQYSFEFSHKSSANEINESYRTRIETINNCAGIILSNFAEIEPVYNGTPDENKVITKLEYQYTSGGLQRDFRRNGASELFVSDVLGREFAEISAISDVPIAIIGAGASGILSGRFLSNLGFRDITLFDKSGRFGGIWSHEDMSGGSRNNPLSFRYDHARLDSVHTVPYQGSGQGVKAFLLKLVGSRNILGQNKPLENPVEADVTAVHPGDLEHKVEYREGDENKSKTYPIVIYAPGLSHPLLPSSNGHAEGVNSEEAGKRWQRQLSSEDLRNLSGKQVIFVGLGNSTAEMVLQIQSHNDSTGDEINYKIITEYPARAVENPGSYVDGKRMFRDVNLPEFTHLAGDLSHVSQMYNRAFQDGNIISDAVHWIRERNIIKVQQSDGNVMSLPLDELYTLIGYGQNPSTNEAMGLTTNNHRIGSIHHDWDGEIQSETGKFGRERIYPGYFAIGPILKGAYNPNAIVIAGIQWQLQEMIPSLIIRAAEYAARERL